MAKLDYFQGKRITLMGLGLLGRGVGDAQFLAAQGAELIVTDLKTEEELKPSLEKLKQYRNIQYTLGRHDQKDFQGRDLIIKGAGVPLDSPYIAAAQKAGVPVEMSTALFVRLVYEQGLDVKIVGVTGTRGKSTITELIYNILKEAGKNVYLGGNVKDTATLPLIEKLHLSADGGDTIVLELDSWQLQGFGEDKISPHIAVFSNFYPDHLDYYNSVEEYWADKVHIFRYQKKGDVLIAGADIVARIKREFPKYKGRLVGSDSTAIPEEWRITLPGAHNRENIACAVCVARELGISEEIIQRAVEAFKGLPERLEFLREIRGVLYYNDNKSTTPEATLAALKALYNEGTAPKNIVLIMGGSDKGLNMDELITALPTYCKAVVLFNGAGTAKIKEQVYALDDVEVQEGDILKDVVEHASTLAAPGDIVLYSPAFTSFGKHYTNVYDRGQQFVEIVKSL